jgi:predicted SAM-dependent methyltransferase
MANDSAANTNTSLKLHIGGKEPREGWKILNIQPGPGVDYVGDCVVLSQFADGSAQEIYASHVYEHLNYTGELQRALNEAHRVLAPGGLLRISVPDLDTLCRLFLDETIPRPVRFNVMRMMFGGQTDAFDFHKTGHNFWILGHFLHEAGFREMRRVQWFGLFLDDSATQVAGQFISLNIETKKSLGPG